MDIEEPERRRRVLIVAYAAHPDASMESRVGWHRAIECARDYETWVLYGDDYDRAELARLARLHEPTHPIRFVRASHGAVGRRLVRSPHLFWQGYALWHRRAFHVARRLHDRWNFDLVHQVSFCGYREPGYTWQLPAPFVIGPAGGTPNFPVAFL